MALFSFLFLLVIATIIITSLIYEQKTHIVAAPTMPWVRKLIINALKKHHPTTNESLNIAELGSGWGGLSFAVAHQYSNAHITGYELSPFPFWVSKIRQFLSRKNVTFERSDFFKTSLKEHDVIICYLSPKHMAWLKPKFEAELKKDAIIISNAFAIPDWTPIDSYSTQHGLKIPVYVYKT